MVLHKIVKQAGVEEVEVPHIGLKDGILIDIVENLYGTSKQAHRDQVTASAMAIGRKYSFDEQHGTTVVRLAGKLFDDTRMLHNLNGEYRLLLEVSALLHDIGQFINTTGHHKHTQYLLTANPVIGLTPSEMVIVANVARYHRKSLPKPQHDTYSALSSKDKVVVSKLASILRVADALDNEHASKVADIAVEYKKPKLTLKLTGEGDMLLERWAVARKSGLFEEVFSTKIVLDE
jgi:exopolyphosphatase/guanosine-5'-triphosphate,3'-diphosphate pyrophosphatase